MYTIVIEHDEDHASHVASDIRLGERKGWDPEDVQRSREELESLESGEWTAYGVTVAKVCECCDQITEEYVAALWGVVVETWNADGRYDDIDRIQDNYLRDVAREVMAEAEGVKG